MSGERGLIARIRTSGGPSLELLKLLAAHRVMSTQQAARATTTPERTTLYRLDRLRKAGLADRVWPGREVGSAPLYWFLRPAGMQLVTGTAPPPGVRQPSALFVPHAAAITEFWLAMLEHGPEQGMVIGQWLTDRAAWQQWPASGMSALAGQEQRLTTDALLGVELHAPTIDGGEGGGERVGRVTAFLEVDLATMTQTQLRVKLARYKQYAKDGAWASWADACPPMLLLTTTEARAATFIRAVARIVKPDRAEGVYQRIRPEHEQVLACADQLIVAAAGRVRDPGAAVAEPVWLLGDETFTPVTLGELLAERHSIGKRAVVIRRHMAAAEQYQETLWWLTRAIDKGRSQLGDTHARQVLDRLNQHSQAERLIADDPELVALLLDWYKRDDQKNAEALTRVLRARHRHLWVSQTQRLLAAGGHRQAGTPAFVRALLTLDRDDLLSDWHANTLDEAVNTDPDQRLADYQRERAEHVQRAWAALSRTKRWRTSRDQISDDYDHEHLRVCGRCAQIIAMPTGTYYHRIECPRCWADQDEFRPYHQRDLVPTVDSRVERLTAVLAKRTKHRAIQAATPSPALQDPTAAPQAPHDEPGSQPGRNQPDENNP